MSIDVIKGLEPKTLWQRFYEITQVPRPSKKEGKIIERGTHENLMQKKGAYYKLYSSQFI